jgi:hypothetical protein
VAGDGRENLAHVNMDFIVFIRSSSSFTIWKGGGGWGEEGEVTSFCQC